MKASIHIYRAWVSRFITVVVGVPKAGEGGFTLCMCNFVETERNALFMECFTNQVPSFGGNMVVFFSKDLNVYAPWLVGCSFLGFPPPSCFNPHLM